MMITVDFDTTKNVSEKIEEYKKQHNVSTFKILKAALKRLLRLFVNENKEVAYIYNPLPETERVRLAHFIEMNFKNKTEFAKEAGLDLSVLVALINNRRCGNVLTWKKINDVFERRGIELPIELKIKYELDDKF